MIRISRIVVMYRDVSSAFPRLFRYSTVAAGDKSVARWEFSILSSYGEVKTAAGTGSKADKPLGVHLFYHLRFKS